MVPTASVWFAQEASTAFAPAVGSAPRLRLPALPVLERVRREVAHLAAGRLSARAPPPAARPAPHPVSFVASPSRLRRRAPQAWPGRAAMVLAARAALVLAALVLAVPAFAKQDCYGASVRVNLCWVARCRRGGVFRSISRGPLDRQRERVRRSCESGRCRLGAADRCACARFVPRDCRVGARQHALCCCHPSQNGWRGCRLAVCSIRAQAPSDSRAGDSSRHGLHEPRTKR